jgi:hypothetical protein
MARRAGVLFLCLCAPTAGVLAAQGSPVPASIDSGTLIRMHQAEGAPIRGRLLRPLDSTSTLVQFCRYPAPRCTSESAPAAFGKLPVESIVRVDVQRGSRWATGAVIGGVIGGVLGGLLGAVVNGLCESADGCGPSTAGYITIGAIGFGGFGALFGSAFPKWREAR